MVINIIVGTILGFLAGLGIGGGSLLILWLTLAQDMPYPQARILNLLFFLPAALITCIFRKKEGKLDLKASIAGIVSGCITALLCSIASSHLDTELLKKILGVLFLVIGVKELLYKPIK